MNSDFHPELAPARQTESGSLAHSIGRTDELLSISCYFRDILDTQHQKPLGIDALVLRLMPYERRRPGNTLAPALHGEITVLTRPTPPVGWPLVCPLEAGSSLPGGFSLEGGICIVTRMFALQRRQVFTAFPTTLKAAVRSGTRPSTWGLTVRGLGMEEKKRWWQCGTGSGSRDGWGWVAHLCWWKLSAVSEP